MNLRKHFGGFNTGRCYTGHGQRIFWEVTDTGDINFRDLDRMICGTLTERHDEILSPAQLMVEYDAGRYIIGPVLDIPENYDFGNFGRL
jgi:hypothetical protein